MINLIDLHLTCALHDAPAVKIMLSYKSNLGCFRCPKTDFEVELLMAEELLNEKLKSI